MKSAIIVFQLLTSSVILALPHGAPKCKITEAVIQQGHERAQSNLGFTLVTPATYTPGGPAIPITVMPTGTAATFKGILAFVTPGSVQDSTLTALPGGPAVNGVPQHIGAFQNLAAIGLRPQTASACAALNVQNDAPESTITHAAPLQLTPGPFTVMWNPPAVNQGTVTVNMVVANSEEQAWEIIPSVQIQSSAGPVAVVGTSAGAIASVVSTGASAASVTSAVSARGAVVTKSKAVKSKAATPTTTAEEVDD